MAEPGSVADRLAKRMTRAKVGGEAGDLGEDEELHLAEVLDHFKLSKYQAAMEEAGVESLDDLAYMQDSDLEKMGMPLIQRRKLLEAVGGSWRSSTEATGNAAARGGGAAAPAAVRQPSPLQQRQQQLQQQRTPRESAGRGGLPSGAEAELKSMLAEVDHYIEDFAEANELDEEARALLNTVPPSTALRAMGLLGRGNNFVMQGVRRPGAAVHSRCRQASAERGASAPFEDWTRLVEDFVSCNRLGEDVLGQLKTLTREQALKVIGFTSGLRFVVQAEGNDAELEVQSRLTSVLSDEPMVPVVRRSDKPRSAPKPWGGPTATQGARHRSRSRGGAKAGYDRFGGGGGGYSQRRGGGGDDLAPHWKYNLKEFIQINQLDERSTQALTELDKIDALRVMGLIGRENSFVIRGVRNSSAAVMQRLAKATKGASQAESARMEPYMQLPRLLEDFIELNRIDERGQEVLHDLTPEALLMVIGITEKNGFLITGVRNTSAALMARVTQAQRRHPTHRG